MTKVRRRGLLGQWVEVDVEIGEPDDLGTWNRQPFLVILNEGFDGLRILVWGVECAGDAADAIRESDVGERFHECDEERGFHYFDRVAQVRR